LKGTQRLGAFFVCFYLRQNRYLVIINKQVCANTVALFSLLVFSLTCVNAKSRNGKSKAADTAMKKTIHKIWQFKSFKPLPFDGMGGFDKMDILDLTNNKFLTIYPDRNKKESQQAAYEIVNDAIVINPTNKETNMELKIKTLTTNTLTLILRVFFNSRADGKGTSTDVLELSFEAD